MYSAKVLHDGLSVTRTDAILRHQGQAAGTTLQFLFLSDARKNQLLTFLNSL